MKTASDILKDLFYSNPGRTEELDNIIVNRMLKELSALLPEQVSCDKKVIEKEKHDILDCKWCLRNEAIDKITKIFSVERKR